MKIDRHNYEQFFILYWDKELTAADSQAVEDFVNQNADLREEFEILGDARFNPGEVVQFKEKDFLLNDSFINITNYEEQLLNYIDDEITSGERKQVEKFVALNPAAQKELGLLQKTKLQPETEISFPDRSILYRREEKPVRVISMTWFRVAVAAAIILIAGFTAFQFINTGKDGITPSVVKVDDPKNNQKENKAPVPQDQNTNEKQQDVADNNNAVRDETTKKAVDKNSVDEGSLASTSTNKPENKNDLPEPNRALIENNKDATQDGLVTNDIPASLKKHRNTVAKSDPDDIKDPLSNPVVTNLSKPTLHIPEAEANDEKDGGGLKEFLRKTTRVFERRTKIQTTTEDNKLLVGAFAVSLK